MGLGQEGGEEREGKEDATMQQGQGDSEAAGRWSLLLGVLGGRG